MRAGIAPLLLFVFLAYLMEIWHYCRLSDRISELEKKLKEFTSHAQD